MIKAKFNFILFMLLACLWSGSFIGIKAVVNVWPPIFGAAIRVGIALLCLMIYIFFTRRNTKVDFSLRWKMWMMGLFSQAIPFLFLFWGERLISPGLAGILNGTVSIWAFIMSLAFCPGLNKFSLNKLAGLLVGIAGVIIIFWPMLMVTRDFSTLVGAGAVLIMAISYAIGSLLNQHFLAGKNRIDFFANIYHQHCASFIFLVLCSFCLEKSPHSTLLMNHIPWLASLYLGIFSTAIAWLIYYHLIREWDAVRASAVMYVVPALTLIWDYLIYANRPHITEIAGVIAILAGVILIQSAKFKQ